MPSNTHDFRLVYWLLLEQSAACRCLLDYLPGSITKFIAGMLRWCVCLCISKWDGNVHETERHLKSKCVRLLTIHRSANAFAQRQCQQRWKLHFASMASVFDKCTGIRSTCHRNSRRTATLCVANICAAKTAAGRG